MAAESGIAETGIPTAAELDARVVSIGAVLFVLADIFYFASWWFAFFYLKSRNENNAWLLNGVSHPNRVYGGFVIGLIVLSALVYWLASRGTPRISAVWELLSPVALVLGTAGAIFGGYQLWHLGFGMTDGGYASVYAGLWGSIVVQFGVAMAWLLSILLQRGPAGDTELRPASPRAFSRILLFLAAASVFSYLILYYFT